MNMPPDAAIIENTVRTVSSAEQVAKLLLTTIRQEIQAILLPELNSAYAKLSAELVCLTLDYLLLEQTSDDSATAARRSLLANLATPHTGKAPREHPRP